MRKQVLRKSLALLCCEPKLQHRSSSFSFSSSFSSIINNRSSHRYSYCFHRFLTVRSLSSSPALDTDGRGPFSPKILRLSDEIAALSDDEVALMSSTLRRKLGLPEPPPLGSMPMASPDWLQDGDSSSPDGAAAPAEKAAEKTSFCVKVEKFEAASKIKVIKEVRAATELGLKEAKEFVEKVPAVVKSGLSKEEAEQLMEKLKAAGATAVVE